MVLFRCAQIIIQTRASLHLEKLKRVSFYRFYDKRQVEKIFSYGIMLFVMESWQSGNAPDSKSGEPSFPWRAGSNPVLSLNI